MIYSTIKKGSISIYGFTITIYFYYVIRKINFNNQKAKYINQAIFYVLTVPIFADFLPNVAYAIGMTVSNLDSSEKFLSL